MSDKLFPTTPQVKLPHGATAALFWIEDEELLFQSVRDGAQVSKHVSPAAARQAFVNEPVDSGWLPPGVNRWGQSSRGTWMLRWHAPALYTVRLAKRKQALKVPMPALVWFGQGRKYYIFAQTDARFEPDGELYLAPLANVNKHGLICFGKNEHPDVTKGGFETAWQTFWAAPFNDDHSQGKSLEQGNNGSINLLLQALARRKDAAYPVKDLVSMKTTLEQALAKLTRREQDAGGDEWD